MLNGKLMKTKVNKPENPGKSSRFFFSKKTESGFFTGQAKLNVGESNDKYEKEADRVADQVINERYTSQPFFSPAENSVTQKKLHSESITPLIQKQDEEEEEAQTKLDMLNLQRESEEEEVQPRFEIQQQSVNNEEEESLQTKRENNTGGRQLTTEQLLKQSRGAGSELNTTVQAEMESGFGADFSNVKIHTDSRAIQLNKDLGARAFTSGNDIYFNTGQYQPHSESGQKLIAHELTHTLQQGASTSQTLVQRSTADEAYQQVADAASGWGTDEEGIFSAIRDCSERNLLRERIQGILSSELSGYDLFKARLLLKYGPETNFPPGILTIWEATDGAGTNEELVYDAIRSSSNRALLKQSTWVQRTLRNEMSGHDYAKTQLLFRYGAESAYPAYINSLWTATVGTGTDESLIYTTMLSMSPAQLSELRTHSTFVGVVRDDLSGDYLQRFNSMLSGTDPAIQANDSTSSYGATQTGPIATIGDDRDDTDEYSPDDITQGAIGDCYFLASLAAIARSNPDALRNRISQQSDGSYNVILYVRNGDNFRQQVVNVTATFPQRDNGRGDLTYANAGDTNAQGTELWVRLFEKAYAKLKGSYDEIEGGFEENALETLLGQEAEELNLSSLTNEQLITRVRAAFRSNQPVTAGTGRFEPNQFTRLNEIVPLHAYTVMDINDDTITLRNPHGESLGGGNLPTRVLPWNIFRRYFSNVTFLENQSS